MDGDADDDNTLPTNQLQLPDIENSQGTGTSQSTMESSENLDGNAQEITISTIEEAIPFFLDSENQTQEHVAEEVEIETSSVGGCINSTNHHHGYIKYACEIMLTLSPLPSSKESTEVTTEGARSNKQQQPMHMIMHEGVEEKNPCVSTSSKGGGGMAIEENVSERESENVILLSEFPTEKSMEEEDQLECESTGSLHENDSMSSLAAAQAVDDSNSPVHIRKRSCANEATTTQGNDDGEAANEQKHSNSNDELHDHASIDKEEDLASGGDGNDDNDDCLNELDSERKDSVAAVRVSCIQWVGKAGDADHPVLRSALQSTSSLQQHENLSISLSSIPDKINETEEDGDDLQYSDVDGESIWIPEITTTTIEEESVQIPEVPQRQMPAKGDLPSCFHPCCLVMRDLWSCLPWWMNYGNGRTCFKPCPSVRPPGFEDPPENEWLTVDIHQASPSDGALRYKCRSCEGFVEYRSTKQKFQLNFSRLKYQCKQCNRKYITKRQLKLHSMRHNEKTRVCTYCDKRFLTQSELRNHLNTHTRERPHQCPVCFVRFAHSSRYYAHIRHIHKKYDCNDCYSKKCCASGNSEGNNANSK